MSLRNVITWNVFLISNTIVSVYKGDYTSICLCPHAHICSVKQELFYTDVTNCVTLLKKVVQDMHSMGASAGQLQMQNPVAR